MASVRERRVGTPVGPRGAAAFPGDGDGSPTTAGPAADAGIAIPSTPASDGDEILPTSVIGRDEQRWCWASACAWPMRAIAPKRAWRRMARSPRSAILCAFLTLAALLALRAAVAGDSVTGHGRPLSADEERQRDASDHGVIEAHPGAFVTRHAQWRAYFVALNLYNNEELLPTFTSRMEESLRDVLVPGAGGDPRAVFVSVMSNGNSDRTSQLIDGPFTAMLKRVGVGYEVRSNATACARWRRGALNDDLGDETDHVDDDDNGYHKRPRDMGRIEWMACLRNSAMRPLYRRGVELFAPARAAAAISADRVAVLFFNDIYFRARDVADLVATNGGRFDLACGLDYYYSFYDTWVTRDVDGARFDPQPPFARVPATQRLLAADREAPVKCCWNGVAAIAADVFLATAVPHTQHANPGTTHGGAGGLRFRANRTTERCYASECQHLCADMLEAGRSRIFVNPRVRVAYETYFDALQHGGMWWYHPHAVEGLLRWLRFWTWPAWYARPPPESLTTAGLQCVTVEETYTLNQATVITWLFVAGVASCVACNFLVARRRLERLNAATLPVAAANTD